MAAKRSRSVRKPVRRAKGRMRKRYVPGVYGQGGYIWDALKGAGGAALSVLPKGTFSGMGTAGGAALGSLAGPAGVPFGAMAGGIAGRLLSKLTGFGAYNVKANSLMPVSEGVGIPTFEKMDQATIVAHREFVADIVIPANGTFRNQSFIINAGLAGSFPWLATIAQNYEQYRFLGLVFEFKSTSTDNVTASSSLAMGSVILATDYDAVDVPFVDKLHMENSQYAMSGKPSNDIMHPIECDPHTLPLDILNVRTGAIPSSRDARFYDLGNFQLAVVGVPTGLTGNIGELWVSYEVALFKPVIGSQFALLADHFNITPAASVSTTNYLGPDAVTSLPATVGSTLGGTILKSTYTFPSTVVSGVYMLSYDCLGASSTLTTAMIAVLSGCATKSMAFGGSVGAFQVYQTAGSTGNDQLQYKIFVVVQSQGATVTLSSGTLPATLTSVGLTVTRLPDSIT